MTEVTKTKELYAKVLLSLIVKKFRFIKIISYQFVEKVNLNVTMETASPIRLDVMGTTIVQTIPMKIKITAQVCLLFEDHKEFCCIGLIFQNVLMADFNAKVDNALTLHFVAMEIQIVAMDPTKGIAQDVKLIHT